MIITINDFGGGSRSGKYEVVTELPSSGKTGTIYLAPSENPQEKNVYNEYVYVNGDWEQFGEKIDLSNYYDKTEVDNRLNNKQDTLTAGEGVYITDNVISTKAPEVPSNEIWYTTSDGLTAQTTDSTGIGELNAMGLVSNTYVDGKGIMKFSKDVTIIGLQTFNNCRTITSIELPNSVTSIESFSFAYCNSLTSVTIRKNVSMINVGAFYSLPTSGTLYCDEDWFSNLDASSKSNLANVANWERKSLPKSIEERVDDLESKKQDVLIAGEGIYISNNVISTSMPKNEIWYTTTDGLTAQTTYSTGIASLNSMGLISNTYVDGKGIMKFSKDVTSIGSGVFYNCTSLTSVEIPNTVTSIGNETFRGCSDLTSVIIPNSVTSIDQRAFYNCTSLTNVTIPNSVASIGDYAFINVPWYGTYSADTNNHYGNIVYINNVAYQATNTGITSVTFKENTISIGGGAFRDCRNLQSIVIPNSVKGEIKSNTFNGNNGLDTVVIGSGITSIGSYTFRNCSYLSSVTLPKTITSIGTDAFETCASSGTLYCDEDWYKSFSSKLNYKMRSWTRKPLPKPLDERVADIEAEIGNINSLLENIIGG